MPEIFFVKGVPSLENKMQKIVEIAPFWNTLRAKE